MQHRGYFQGWPIDESWVNVPHQKGCRREPAIDPFYAGLFVPPTTKLDIQQPTMSGSSARHLLFARENGGMQVTLPRRD